MNEIVNKFLSAEDKFMPEMHLRQPASLDKSEYNILHVTLVDHLQKTRKESRHFKKQEIHNIFIKTNDIKLVFNMTWLMEILKI